MSYRSQAQEVVREARRLGLEVHRRANSHYEFVAPDGRSVIMGSTPGSAGAIRRAASQVRRLAAGEPVTAAHRRRA